MIAIEHPPAMYLPYDGPLARVVRSQPVVAVLCRLLGLREPGKVYGCSVWVIGGCLQIIADVPERKEIEAHEDAHCNGWPRDHPR